MDDKRPVRLLVCGGRTQHLSLFDRASLRRFITGHVVTEMIHGGANGIDSEAGALFKELGIPVREFPAEWDRYKPTEKGRKNPAGFIRNNHMLDHLRKQQAIDGAQPIVVAFPGGNGTAHTVGEAGKLGITILDCR